MENKTKPLSIILFLSASIVLFSFGGQEAEWKGKIEYENGVKVIKNPEGPLYGEIKFELEEDLSLGNEEDENYMFFTQIISDDLGNIYVSRITKDLIKKKELGYDLFNQEGYYIYKVIMPPIVPSLIRSGYLFSILIDRETSYFKIKRYKVKNWDMIKKGI